MRRAASSALLACVLTACAALAPTRDETPDAIQSAPVAEAAPVPSEPAEILPVRGEGPASPAADAVLTRVALGACADEAAGLPIFAGVAAARPDLFVFMGDAVRCGAPSETPPAELKAAYGALNLNAHFASFNMSTPILAVWGSGDSGSRDAAAEAERVFETYWGAAAVGGGRPGVYGARSFGPPGRRVQLLMLDASSFRSATTLLGPDQWRWLEAELREAADVRLLVTPAPALLEAGAADAWGGVPGERDRLLEALRRRNAGAVVLVSGGEPAGVRQANAAHGRLFELTASPLTGSGGRAPEFALIEIDWGRKQLALSLRGPDGAARRSLSAPFPSSGTR